MDRLVGLREDILNQDYRVLYLAWLKAIELEGEFAGDAEPEPPVPPGLHKLSPALRAFVDLFEIDEHLQQYTAKGYDEVTRSLARLHELAVYKRTEAIFQQHLNHIYEQYSRRPSLLERLRKAGLHQT